MPHVQSVRIVDSYFNNFNYKLFFKLIRPLPLRNNTSSPSQKITAHPSSIVMLQYSVIRKQRVSFRGVWTPWLCNKEKRQHLFSDNFMHMFAWVPIGGGMHVWGRKWRGYTIQNMHFKCDTLIGFLSILQFPLPILIQPAVPHSLTTLLDAMQSQVTASLITKHNQMIQNSSFKISYANFFSR
jgi:hypothetical protein